MKKKSLLLITVVLFIFVVVFAGCDLVKSTSQTDGEVFYEYNGSKINTNKWIAISSESLIWTMSTGAEGSLVEEGNQYYLSDNKKNVAYEAAVDTGVIALYSYEDEITTFYYQTGYDPSNTNKSVVNLFAVAKDSGYSGTLEELIALFKGENGRDGVGISGITKSKTEGNVDTYTISLSDGSTYDFTVTNGEAAVVQNITVEALYEAAKETGFTGTLDQFLREYISENIGKDGVGIEKIEKTGSNGNVDVYTITLTDDTTYDFTVVNGKDVINEISIDSLYQKAVEEGYEGTYLDFVREYLNVENGEDLSVYATAQMSTVTVMTTDGVINEGEYVVSNATSTSGGSGVIYSLDKENGNAYIVTAYHMVYNSNKGTLYTKFYVYPYGNSYGLSTPIECTLIGGSAIYDTAVLKITNSDILKNSIAIQASITDSDLLCAGEVAIASGSPESTKIGVTKGIITYVSEDVEWTRADSTLTINSRFIRIDTALNHGNSGGGIYNINGEVIGIVCGGLSPNATSNIGYIIPSNICFGIADNIISQYEANPEAIPYKTSKPLFGLTSQVDSSYGYYDEQTKQLTTRYNVKIVEISETSILKDSIQVDDIVKTVYVNDVAHEINAIYTLVDMSYRIKVG
ncbi:MAG: trypsin-like peptidase domain-containing protein, partial [Clostridia bacterium]|nr:trypsin-like peptidase domain-containing protein [Clostridia bacterium]